MIHRALFGSVERFMGVLVDHYAGAFPLWLAPEQVRVLAVKDAAEQAVAHCRAGKGPYLLEVKTYRYRGHSMSDPAKYRTREEVEKVRHDQDPIEQVRNRLLAADVSEQDLKAIDADVRKIVNEAADFAQADPEPDVSELYTDVYR